MSLGKQYTHLYQTITHRYRRNRKTQTVQAYRIQWQNNNPQLIPAVIAPYMFQWADNPSRILSTIYLDIYPELHP
ncbi:hypothetical protein D3C84_1038220 [compost metagenome]